MDKKLKDIAVLLNKSDLSARFRVGKLLSKMQKAAGPTQGKKFIDHISNQLKQLGTKSASVNNLLKCRKLSEEWSRRFVDDLQHRGVPWHAVLKGLFACSQAKSLGGNARTKAVAKIKTHLRKFPKKRQGKEVKQWLKLLTQLKNGFAPQLGIGGQLKQLFEARDAIDMKLRDAKDRLKKIRKLLAHGQRSELDDEVSKLDQIASSSAALFDARLKELRLEGKSQLSRSRTFSIGNCSGPTMKASTYALE